MAEGGKLTFGDWLKIGIPLLVAVLGVGGQQVRVTQAQDQAGAYRWRAEECVAIWKALDEITEEIVQ